MSQKSRQEMLEPARERYGRRGRQGRSRLLDEVCALCGYERKHALKVLGGSRGHCRPWWSARGIFAGLRRGPEHAVLKKIWLAAEQPCGKRLVAALPVWLPYYEKRYGMGASARVVRGDSGCRYLALRTGLSRIYAFEPRITRISQRRLGDTAPRQMVFRGITINGHFQRPLTKW